MLMHGTPSRMPLPPRANTPLMEPTQALQPCHRNAHLKLLETNRALGRIHTVLLRRRVRKHAREPAHRRDRRQRRLTADASTTSTTSTRSSTDRRSLGAVRAVGRDARVDVGLAQRLKIRQRAARELAVTDGALVFLGDLGRRGLRLELVRAEGVGFGEGGGGRAC